MDVPYNVNEKDTVIYGDVDMNQNGQLLNTEQNRNFIN